MKTKSDKSAVFRSRSLTGLLVLLAIAFLVALGSGAFAKAIARQGETKSAVTRSQSRSVKPRPQQPDQAFWAQTNGPEGGDGIALATNPSGHVVVGTQGGGVSRTTDNGETWLGVNEGLTDTNVRALAINNAGNLFAGTWRSEEHTSELQSHR